MSSKEEQENPAPAPLDDENGPDQGEASPGLAAPLPSTSTRPTIKNN